MQQQLTGLIAAPFTAFCPDGSLNLDVIESQARLLADHGVRVGSFAVPRAKTSPRP